MGSLVSVVLKSPPSNKNVAIAHISTGLRWRKLCDREKLYLWIQKPQFKLAVNAVIVFQSVSYGSSV